MLLGEKGVSLPSRRASSDGRLEVWVPLASVAVDDLAVSGLDVNEPDAARASTHARLQALLPLSMVAVDELAVSSLGVDEPDMVRRQRRCSWKIKGILYHPV